jgi:hypothetical protein
MTCPGITPEVTAAAEFIQRHHNHIPLDHPAMEMAADTLRRAGVWSPGEVAKTAAVPTVEIFFIGTFCAGDRRRLTYTILADGIEIGTAVHWTAKTQWPWGLTLPAGCVVNFGFRDRSSLLKAVERFVKTGEIA